jgi:CubicO group peptidase (beta-lactamase class C family)
MAVHRLRRVLFWFLAVIATLVLLLVAALVALDIPRNAAGMAAKGVCSAAFVAGRPWQTLLADDVLPASPALAPISIQIDGSDKSVTARFAGLFARQARLLPDRGCVLDVATAAPVMPTENAPRAHDPALPWPQGEAALPADQWGPGVNTAALQKLAQDTFRGAGDPQSANARAMAVVHRGRLLLLRSAPGFAPATPLHGWSMTKTVAGMLAYKLASETGLAADTPVVDAFGARGVPPWVAQWRADTRRTIRVADLLTMRDGLANTEDYDPWGSVPRMLWGHADAPAYAAQAGAEAPPATRWRYLSQTANLLAAVSRSRMASDAAYWAYPAQALFRSDWRHDGGARDRHRRQLGGFVLPLGQCGRLGPVRAIDAERWPMGIPTGTPARLVAPGCDPRAGAGEGRGYGAQVWRIGDPEHGECKGHGLPPDTLAMIGHWGQVLAMVPSREAVIVRLGWTFRRKQFDSCAFVAEALRALPHQEK